MNAMRRWAPRVLVGAALAILALAAALAVLPARWLITLLPADAPLAIVDASGTVWAGTALVALGPPGARTTLPDPIRWQTGWDAGLRALVHHPWLECSQLAIRAGWSGLGLGPCQVRLPAETLATLGAPLNTLKPSGTLRASWPGLRLPYRGGVPSGQLVTLDWTLAGSALSPVRPLGDYRVQMTGDNGAAHVSIATLRGVLQVQGEGSFSPTAAARFSGRAGPAPGTPDTTIMSLQGLLSAIGRRSGDETLFQFGR
ncbi:type II secretion system protein N [Verticiella sediminum]|uniref:Type II secretion system protein N n=1 Tax=Verticiella sediminum TaxID=1247510 RepID=A0A556ACP3_9BURK|nr:type II secretion system protein N [Verticiella sediminum]TSH90648.1 type II secretion system protein N [Verticiella sediminum]